MIRGTKVYFGDAARDLERMEWDLAHPGLRWSDVGIPLRETHAVDPQRVPHRSVWRLTHHKGDDCVWARVRISVRRHEIALFGAVVEPNSPFWWARPGSDLPPRFRHAQETDPPGGVVDRPGVRHTG